MRAEARGAFRTAILRAAERVFSETGFYAARMSDIAREAGVGVGTLYNYFDSKDVILVEILQALHEEFMAALGGAGAASDPIDRLRQMVTTVLGSMEEHGALFAVFSERGAVGEYDLERLAGPDACRGFEQYLELMESAIREAVQKKRIRSDVEPRLIVSALSGAINGAMYAWLKGERQGRLSEVVDDLFDLFLQGARHP